MAIDVICTSCHARFRVNDKFAGKKGPCPKCKVEIRVPTKEEQVVIHDASEFEGIKDSKGRAVLKPIARKKTKISKNLIIGVAAGSVMVLFLALALRLFNLGDGATMFFLTLGAIVLAPPLALGGYAFLRDDELEPYQGTELIIRTAICSVVYAALWGAFALSMHLFFGELAELWHLAFVVPPFMLAGSYVGYMSFDLEFGSGVFHYGLYLLVTVVLRMIMTGTLPV
jgi:hypothetical protein